AGNWGWASTDYPRRGGRGSANEELAAAVLAEFPADLAPDPGARSSDFAPGRVFRAAAVPAHVPCRPHGHCRPYLARWVGCRTSWQLARMVAGPGAMDDGYRPQRLVSDPGGARSARHESHRLARRCPAPAPSPLQLDRP